MLALDFESVWEALYNTLLTVPGLVTVSRRVQTAAQVPNPMRPALYIEEGDFVQEVDPSRGAVHGSRPVSMRSVWSLEGSLIVYISVGSDPSLPTTPPINTIASSIAAVFEPEPGASTGPTLGHPRVEWARIVGKMVIHEGVQDGNGIIVVPIKMRVR